MGVSSASAADYRVPGWRVPILYRDDSVRMGPRAISISRWRRRSMRRRFDVEARAGDVILDRRAVTFIDASGIDLLMRHDAPAHSDGFVLSVIPPTPSVTRVLHVAEIWPLLPVVEAARRPRAGDSAS